MFSAEEEAFIEGAVAFLRERSNADVIIEEVWTHAVLDREDGADERLEQDAPVTDQIAAAEDGEHITEPETGDPAAPPIEDEGVMPIEPPVSRARPRNAAGSSKAEAAAAKSPPPQPATSRGKPKRDAGEIENGGDA